ncbi:wall-associated receptor kinase-like 10 [Alnus glutinosa]|uniref:wall-associated receptor kinase-like 10 n=1 Tax=Alnus glutinosa TaxID=3517 RepID=UPI002D786496|nr:wall-associated receptor kinase-like 10 [Alnus glutinosa]
MAVKMVFQIMIVLLCSIDAILYVQAAGLAINSSCQAKSCGNLSNIPYPFGIGVLEIIYLVFFQGAGCYLDRWFEVVCMNDSSGSPKPFLSSFGLEVLNISSIEGAYDSGSSTVRVNYPTFSTCTNSSSRKQNVELANSSFIFSQFHNIFVAMGCDNSASMRSSDNGSMIGCMSRCDSSKVVINGSSCNGTNCCQTTIASDVNVFETTIDPIKKISDPAVSKECNSAFLVEEKWFRESGSLINMSSIMSHVPVVLEWMILETSFNTLPIANKTAENTEEYFCFNYSYISASKHQPSFTCYCRRGFEGNPYLLGGCGGKIFTNARNRAESNVPIMDTA